jgi:antitoxin component of MazEF toxin-antitoxin module
MINEEDLRKLIEIRADIDKITTLSFDGKNLLTRIPKEIREFLKMKKGDKIRWLVDSDKKIILQVITKNEK